MENKTKYWKGLEELNRDPQFVQLSKNEFAEGLPLDEVFQENDLNLTSNRRDFLKFFGFGVSAVALAACNKAPVKNVIPYVVKPEVVTPGVPNYYASTWKKVPVVVKTREGRPIKLEGNEKSTISQGGLNAQGHASLLSLYDKHRLPAPIIKGKRSNWADLDKQVKAKLEKLASNGSKIALVTNPDLGPASLNLVNEFKSKFSNTTHITFSPIGYDGIYQANELTFGKSVIPTYHFDKAEVIVSFDADFLGTWLNDIQYSKDYIKNRVPSPENPSMSRHIQFEALLSLTGTNADYRFPLQNQKQGLAIMSLYNQLAKQLGQTQIPTPSNLEVVGNAIEQTAKNLLKSKGKSLVVCGSNDPYVQALVNQINLLLGNYGNTIDLDNYYMANTGDISFAAWVKEINAYKGVIFYNTNPVYAYQSAETITTALGKMDLTVSTGYYEDETATLCEFIAPDLHWLESWDLAEISKGEYSFTQPTISPVFETRQAQESLAIWMNHSDLKEGKFNYYEYLRNFANKEIYAKNTSGQSFDAWWNNALHEGVCSIPKTSTTTPSANILASELKDKIVTKAEEQELVLYRSVGLGDGMDGNNPWLYELPDPISKVTWDNYLSIAKKNADEMGLKDGDVVNISNGQITLEKVPVLIQPGQVNNSFGLALGFGRNAGVQEKIGFNAYPLATVQNGTVNFTVAGIKIEKTAGKYELAQTQTHHSIEARDIVREASLNEFKKNPSVGNADHLAGLRSEDGALYTLWKEFDYKGHKWGLAVDMNACTGCSACVISCSIENNVPVVGRDEIRRRREMHWIRIDRYYSFSLDGAYETEEKKYNKAEDHQNVRVVHQPMMCQHCGHAPCETVCPVLATTHSTDGLNQMTYNRCIGTKYCANNCPYKVRRFNWFRYNDNDNFDYYFNNDLGKMVINPDVTVRTRGVMEKCSMCVQRIQAGKLTAKLEGRKIKDGEIQTACSQSCPADAIVFGDMNDPESKIAKHFAQQRSYTVLEELNVQPSVRYMTKIRNVEEAIAESETAAHH